MNGFPAVDCNRTGGVGTIIVIGKDKEAGVCRAINLDRSRRDRNYGGKDRNNIDRDPRFSGIRKRSSNNEDNRRFGNLGDSRGNRSRKDSRRSGHPRGRSTPGNSNPSPGACNARGSRNVGNLRKSRIGLTGPTGRMKGTDDKGTGAGNHLLRSSRPEG